MKAANAAILCRVSASLFFLLQRERGGERERKRERERTTTTTATLMKVTLANECNNNCDTNGSDINEFFLTTMTTTTKLV